MKVLLNAEVLRRLALVVGLFAAVVMFLNPASPVYKVELVDFAKKLRSQKSWNKSFKLPLQQYIPKETRDSVKQVSGLRWQEVLQKLLADQRGNTPPDWKENRYRHSGRRGEFYFGPETEPFASLAPKPGGMVYLALEHEGRTLHIALNPQRPKYARHAPSQVRYPLRFWSWLPLGLGFVIYFFMPRVKCPAGSLGYQRLWGLVFSDFLGLIWTGFFFALPLVMLLEKGKGLGSLFDFAAGWAWLTIIMWLFCGFGLSMLAIGVWYRNFWILFDENGITRHAIIKTRELKYAEMKKAGLAKKPAPKWLLGGLLAFGSGNPTAMGQAAILAGQNHLGIGINLKNDRPLWIRLEALENPLKLLRSLRDNGVELDQALQGAFAK